MSTAAQTAKQERRRELSIWLSYAAILAFGLWALLAEGDPTGEKAASADPQEEAAPPAISADGP